MISKIINNSKLNWIDSSKIPELYNHKSKDLILIFEDGFISRGYYYNDSWYGYNNEMELEHYISNPKYYIIL